MARAMQFLYATKTVWAVILALLVGSILMLMAGANPIAAYRWYSLAARAGDGESARRRELLKTKLDPQAMAQADAAVAEWRPQLSDRASNDPRAAGEAWKLRASNTAN